MYMRLVASVVLAVAVAACGALLGVDAEGSSSSSGGTTPAADVAAPGADDDASGGSIVDGESDASSVADGGDAAFDAAADAAADADADAGMPPKIVFVTEYAYDGAWNDGIAGADQDCKDAVATSPDVRLNGHKASTWKAYLAAADGTSAAARFTIDHVWTLLNGTVVFTESPAKQALPNVPIVITERGTDISPAALHFVWTGMTTGTVSADQRTCAGWTDTGAFGGYGDAHLATAGWDRTSTNTAPCNDGNTYRLYCFED